MGVLPEKNGDDGFQPCAELIAGGGGCHFSGKAQFQREAAKRLAMTAIVRQCGVDKLMDHHIANAGGVGQNRADEYFPCPVGAPLMGQDLPDGFGGAYGEGAGNADFFGKGRSGGGEYRAHIPDENGKPFLARREGGRDLPGFRFRRRDDFGKIRGIRKGGDSGGHGKTPASPFAGGVSTQKSALILPFWQPSQQNFAFPIS